jgi:hypothetical protein
MTMRKVWILVALVLVLYLSYALTRRLGIL